MEELKEGVFDEELKKISNNESEEASEKSEKIGQNQVYDIVTGRQSDWQTLIYDLIHAEQLDPWDIDIVILTNKYFEKIYELEETDYYISSKVLLAAALLLRIKSEFLLNKYIRSIDDILFGKKEDKRLPTERIEIDGDDLPILIPKTPLPRLRQVTLNELMAALNKAISTESRRIKREVAIKRAKKLSEVDFPTFRKIDLKDRIRQFYARILTSIKKRANGAEKHTNKVGYTELTGVERDEKLACFLPVLHLSNTKKLWLEQENHLEEIWIYLYEYFEKNKEQFMEELEEDIETMKTELGLETSESNAAELLDEDFERTEMLKKKKQEKEQLKKDALKELESELMEITNEKAIDEATGFSQEQE
jgi:segregation and condensation protein A